MAVIHPEDRIARVRGEKTPLHPAVGLLVGFGFIVGVATLVHVLFSAAL
jgi:hypothetical protein